MAKANPTITIEVSSKMEELIKKRYEDYVATAEEDVLTFEEFNVLIFKIGILSNEIRLHETEKRTKEEEVGNLNAKIYHLKEEYHENRKKLNYSRY